MINHGASLLLGAGVAALTLLLVHLFGLRIRQTVQFTHEHFLRSVVAQSRSSQKLQNILLLLLRSIFVGALLVGFYFLFQQPKSASDSSLSNAVLLLDDSWSMASPYGEGAISKLNQAIQDIQKLNSEGVTRQALSGNSFIRSGEEAQLSELLPSFVSGSQYFPASLQRRSSQLLFFSDFQRNSNVQSLLKKLPAASTLLVYPSGTQANIYIDSVWLTEPPRGKADKVEIDIRIAGSKLTEPTQVTVRSLQGPVQLGVGQILLEPSKPSVFHFSLAPQASEKPVSFLVDDPRVKFDNEFFAVLPSSKSIGIYTSPALSPDHPVMKAFKEEPAFSISETSPGIVASLWVLDAARQLSNWKGEQPLQEWLSKGGQLLILPAASDNTSLVQLLAGLGIKGVHELGTDYGKLPLKAPNMHDPFFQQIFEKREQNLSMPEVSPVLQWRNAYQDILRFQNGTPFLSTFRVGKGQVHLFAAPVNSASAFAAHPLFVPVLYQLAWGGGTQQLLAHTPVNGTIAIPLSTEETGNENAAYQLKKGEQTFVPDAKFVNGQLMLTLPPELHRPGIYTLYRGDKWVRDLAINIPRSESKLEAYTRDELEEMLPEGSSIKVVNAGDQNIPLEKQLQKDPKGPMLWKYCLILCLLCLMAETLILTSKKRGSLSQSG